MKEKLNWKSLFAGVVIILLGIISCVISAFVPIPWDNILLSVGCSLIASGLVILMHDFFVERTVSSPLDKWNLKLITSTRAEINPDCEAEMAHVKSNIDIIAFGLRSFRTTHTDSYMLYQLKRGVDYRILTMNPNSSFVLAREQEENNKNIKDSIEELIAWADDLNEKSPKGKIIIKGYSSMTLDFYWRVDDVVYVGPYWNGLESQQTITYKFCRGGKGYKIYSAYFEKLWNNKVLTTYLTKKQSTKKQKHN